MNSDRDLSENDESVSNRNNLIGVTAIVEFRGVVKLVAAGRKSTTKNPSGYTHYLMPCALFSSTVRPQL